mmetsp:Transcript_22674/g.46078  ORF Transcript_22674/g.46078 Transcript_22674/m.46078 type:complete len:264 (-) Transcript_22674:2383-3174(-)
MPTAINWPSNNWVPASNSNSNSNNHNHNNLQAAPPRRGRNGGRKGRPLFPQALVERQHPGHEPAAGQGDPLESAGGLCHHTGPDRELRQHGGGHGRGTAVCQSPGAGRSGALCSGSIEWLGGDDQPESSERGRRERVSMAAIVGDFCGGILQGQTVRGISRNPVVFDGKTQGRKRHGTGDAADASQGCRGLRLCRLFPRGVPERDTIEREIRIGGTETGNHVLWDRGKHQPGRHQPRARCPTNGRFGRVLAHPDRAGPRPDHF